MPPGFTAIARVIAAPPFTEIFFSLPLAKKPIHWPSGENDGPDAPSVPAIGFASLLSSGRRKSCCVPLSNATYTRFLPSGEMAIAGWSSDANRCPEGKVIATRLTDFCCGGLRTQAPVPTPTLRITAAAHGRPRRHPFFEGFV